MSRVQLALERRDRRRHRLLKLFATEPAKVRPGYANFAIDEPPLKLVLIENEGPGGTLNHLGVEVFTAEVAAAQARLAGEGLATASRTAWPVATPARTRCGSTALRRAVGDLHGARGRRDAQR